MLKSILGALKVGAWDAIQDHMVRQPTRNRAMHTQYPSSYTCKNLSTVHKHSYIQVALCPREHCAREMGGMGTLFQFSSATLSRRNLFFSLSTDELAYVTSQMAGLAPGISSRSLSKSLQFLSHLHLFILSTTSKHPPTVEAN